MRPNHPRVSRIGKGRLVAVAVLPLSILIALFSLITLTLEGKQDLSSLVTSVLGAVLFAAALILLALDSEDAKDFPPRWKTVWVTSGGVIVSYFLIVMGILASADVLIVWGLATARATGLITLVALLFLLLEPEWHRS